MAVKLQCELCGGKLIGRPGGIFACETCGAEYSTEWAKARIQEITGAAESVRTARPDVGDGRETLLQRGSLALEDGEWDKAKSFFELALNVDPRCAEAYLGLAMAEEKCRNRTAFLRLYTAAQSALRLKNSSNLRHARQFSPALNASFAKLDEEGKKADETAREEREKALAETIRRLGEIRRKTALPMRMIGAASHTVGLRADGTACAVGWNEYQQCEIADWTALTAVAAGGQATVGLLADGTVIAAGNNEHGQCEVSDWKDIAAVAAGSYHTVGLREDGTVIATKYIAAKRSRSEQDEDADQADDSAEDNHPVALRADGTAVNMDYNDAGQCEVSDWKNITAVSAGCFHTVGLRADGTAAATRYTGNPANDFGQCEVSDWENIVAVAAGKLHTVGLHADGTVVAVGANVHGQCEVSDWRDMVAVAAGDGYTLGLCADGSVAAKGICGNMSGWTDIVAIAAGSSHTVGLRADGTLLAAGMNICGECEVSGWKLFDSLATLEAEHGAAVERAMAERRAAAAARKAKREALGKEQTAMQSEHATLRGLFTGRRRREIEARLAEIEAELKMLS